MFLIKIKSLDNDRPAKVGELGRMNEMNTPRLVLDGGEVYEGLMVLALLCLAIGYRSMTWG